MKKLYARIGFLLFPILLPLMRYVLRRSSRVYVVITYEGKLLLVKNWLARDTWRFPGGGVGRAETNEEAAVREVREELGMNIDIGKLRYLSSGKLLSDSLGAEYSIYHCQLTIKPHITPSRIEIIDWQFFEEIPDEMFPDFLGVGQSLLKK